MRKVGTLSFLAGLAVIFLLTMQSYGQQSEQAVRELVPKIVAAWETFDLAKIEPYYAKDADLTYFD